jgi:hypothetical protein
VARAKATPQKAPAKSPVKAGVASTDDKVTAVDATNSADPKQEAVDQSSQSETTSATENSATAKPEDGKAEGVASAEVINANDKASSATSGDAINSADPKQDADQSSQSETNSPIESSAAVKHDDDKPEDEASANVVMIRTKRGIQQFRRAGFTFTREARPIDISALSLDQVRALENEPRLEEATDLEPAQ